MICLALLAVPWAVSGQSVVDYRLDTGVDTTLWVNLSSAATDVTAIEGEDDMGSELINIGFPFTFAGTTYSQFSCNSNGRVRLGTACSEYWDLPFTTLTDPDRNDLPFITAFGMDNTLGGTGSHVKYELVGTSPNRILVIEYRTPSEYDEDGDLVNYQIHLMEDSNRVRFVYGTTTATYFDDYQIGIASLATDYLMINPLTHSSFTSGTSTAFSSWPGHGRYYQLTQGAMPSCPDIINLAVNFISSGYASLSWDFRNGTTSTPTGFEVVCRGLDSSATVVTLTTATPNITLSGLTANTSYSVSVRAICAAGDYGEADSITITTSGLPCLVIDPNTVADTINFSNGTSTSSGVLVYSSWGNTMYQTVYTADELRAAGLRAGGILAVDFGFSTNSSYAKEFSIFMGNTTRTSFSSSTDYVNPGTLTHVYGPTAYPQNSTGWQHFNLSQPFVWDGVSNIIVCTFMNQPSGSSHSSSSFSGYYTSAHSGASLYRYKDGTQFTTSNYTTSSGGSTTSNRASIHFYTAGCLQTSNCTAPTVWFDSIGTHELTVAWLPGYQETSWDVEYRVQGSTTWTTAVTGDTNTWYTITGLTPATFYDVRVVNVCDSVTYSTMVSTVTECVPIDHTELPYHYGFEDLTATGSGTPLNVCWNRGYWNGSYSSTSYPYASTTACTGSRSLYFYSYNNSSVKSWVCLPEFADSVNTLRLQFMAKKNSVSYDGQIRVGVMTDPTDINTFQEVGTFHTDVSTDWKHHELTLGDAPSTGLITLMVEASPNMYNYMYIDDIRVDEIPFCTTPMVDSIVAETTQASFYLSEIENASSVIVRLSTTDWDTTVMGSSSPVIITDLVAGTVYNYRIHALCGTDSTLYRAGTFHTQCSPIAHDALPYSYGFEDLTVTGSGSPIHPCWDRGYWNGSLNVRSYPYTSTTNHTGSRSLYFYGSGSSIRSWVCLPEFEDSINMLQLDFWARSSSTSYSGEIKVGVMTDPADFTTFQTVYTASTDGSTNWNHFDIPLVAAPGSGRLTFMVEGGSSNTNYMYLDDITVQEIPACPHVMNIRMDSMSVDWANISWTEMGTASNWVIEYDTVDFVPGTYTASFSAIAYDTTYLLSGLDTGTTYYLYLRADCGGDTSTFQQYVFTTLVGLPATVPYLCSFEGSGTNGWVLNNGTQTNQWHVGSAVSNGGSQSLYISNDNGLNNSYTTSSISYVFAERNFNLPDTGEYVYSFDWRTVGESSYDFIRAALVPANVELTPGSYSGFDNGSSVPSGSIALDGGGRLNQQSNWQSQSGTFHLTTPGAYKWVFMWRNDGSAGTQPPAAIDNVQLAFNSCPMPTNLTVSDVTSNSATISWTPGGNESEWVVGDGVNENNTTSTTYTFTGLSAMTHYAFSVRAVCGGGDTSIAAITSARTACGYITLPFAENFDNTAGTTSTSASVNNLPECWNHYNAGTNSSYSGYPIVYNSSTYAHSGTNSMRWYSYVTAGSYEDQYAILPPVDSNIYPISSLALNFWMRANTTSYNSYCVVGVMTDSSDVTSFNPVETVYTNSSTTYNFHEILFDEYTGNHGRIAIRFPRPTSGYNYGYIDDIRLEVAPDCPRVTDIIARNFTNTSVDLSWTENGDASSWDIEYGPHGFTPGSGTSESVFSLPHTINSLTPNTQYDVYVTPSCYGTSATNSFTFRTECDAMTTLPYTYGFENEATGSSTSTPFVNCWHRLNNGSQYYGYPYVSSSAHNGSRSLYWYTSTTTGTYGDYQIAVLPAIDVDLYAINTLMLKFWARSTSSSYYPVFQVGVMTDPYDANTFEQVGSINVDNSTQWSEYSTGLSNYSGTGRYIALRALRGGWYAYTDDFTIDLAPSCPAVNEVVAVQTGTTGALLQWTLQPGIANTPSDYTVTVTPADTTMSTLTLTATSTQLLVTGLQPSSEYSVTVRPNCGGEDHGTTSPVMTFSTTGLPCLIIDTTATDTVTLTGSTTNTNYYIPVNNFYNYTISQQLVMADELNGASRITAIDFYYDYSSPTTDKTNCTIYLANTTVSSLASGYVPYNASSFTRVYTGDLNCTNGWNHFEFTTPFDYDGSSNIVIAVHDNSGAYDGSEYVFRAHQVSNGIARYTNNDGSAYSLSDFSSGGTSYSYRTDMRLTMDACLMTDSCAAPMVVVDSVSAEEVTISWSAGLNETQWTIDYREGSGAWTSEGTVFSNSYTFSGLTPATTYTFRVTTQCSDSNLRSTTVNVTTPCLPTPVPFFEDFENFSTSTADPLPSCWYKNTNYSTNYPYASTSYNHSSSGNRSMYMYSTSSTYTYMVLPQFDLPIDSTSITFWLYKSNNSYAHTLSVGVMTDPTDVSTFYEVTQVTPTQMSVWEPFEVNFNTYTGSGQYITIMSPNGSYSYPYLDDLEVNRISSCPRVSNVTSRHVTGTSATIAWNNTIATDYEVEYGPAGFSHGSGNLIYVSSDDSVAISGLSASTLYDVYVRGICDSDTSNWSFSHSFFTVCGLVNTLPLVQTFENEATGSSTSVAFANCWNRLNNGTSYFGYPYISNSTTYNHTRNGSKGLYWYGSITSGTYGDYQIVVSPGIDTDVYAINTLRYKFWARSSSTSYNPTFYVGVMTDPDDPETFTPVDTINIAGNTSWTCYTTDFDTFNGFGNYLALYAPRPSSSWYAYVDDITISLIPDCEGVSDVQVVDISTTSATLDWTENGEATSWDVEYGEAGFTRGTGTTTTVALLPYAITGLNVGTEYDIYITPSCTGDIAETVQFTFSTECAGIDSLPFTETFETRPSGSSSNDIFIPCWHRLNNGSMYFGYPYVSSSTTYNHTTGGSRGLYWYNSSTTGTYGDYQIVVLPPVDTTVFPLTDLELTFWAKSSADSYHPVFEVGVMPNPYNAADSMFEVLGTINVSNSTQWDEYSVGLNQHVGPGCHVAIRALRNSAYWYAYVDDITLSVLPPCPRVLNLAASNISVDSARITWQDTSSINTSWLIEYDTLEFQPGTGAVTPITVTDTFYTLTGLDTGATYHVYVYPSCSDGVFARHLRFATRGALPATLPFICDFEGPRTNGFDLINGTQTNTWHVGTATAATGNKSLYISNNNGLDNSYSISTTSNVFATRDIIISQSGEYHYSYQWKATGESCCDYIRVALIPETHTLTPNQTNGFGSGSSIPADAIILDNGDRLNQVSSWQTVDGDVIIADSGIFKLVFFWHNDGSVGTQPPAAIDNILLARNTCPRTQNIHAASATENSIILDWTDFGTPTAWQIEYGPTGYTFGTAAGTQLTVTSHPVPITGLNRISLYDFYIRPICSSTDTGFWPAVPATLSTSMCANSEIVYSYDSTLTPSTSSYAPIGYGFYNYSYVQTIIDSATIASLSTGDLNALAFNPANTTAGDEFDHMNVYLANVPESDLSASFIYPDTNHQFVQVIYDRNFSYTTTGWQLQPFDSVFTWDGHSNLLVAINRLNGSYTSGASFNSHSTTTAKTRYVYNDGSPYNINTVSGGTALNAVGDIMFYSCVGNICNEPIVTSTTTTYHSATLTWNGNSTDYQVNLRASSELNWPDSAIDVTGTTYTFASLQPATTYFYRLRSNCTADSLGFSNWVEGSFLTDSLPCLAPDSLRAIAVTNATATFDWNVVGNESTWDIHVWFTGGLDSVYRVTSRPATIGGFAAGLTYNAAIRPLCGVNLLEGEWGDTVTFATATCPDVTGLSTSNVTTNSVTLTWTADPMAQSWTIEYGFRGFDQGTGTSVNVSSNSYTVTGLLDDTEYEFYVRAVCGTDWVSENLARTTATTQIGDVICDAPTGVNTSVADNSISVNWTAGEGNISFEIEYGPHGFTHGSGTSTNATSSPATLANLDYETQYDIYVRAICDLNTFSNWSTMATATTGQRPSDDCLPVSNLSVSDITDNSAHVSWTPAEGSDSWQVVVTDPQGADIVDVIRNESNYDIADLTPGTNYSVKVRTVCGDGNFSSYVSTTFRTTGGQGIDNASSASCAIYPNPTSNATTISVSGVNGRVKIEVVDMNGRTLTSETMECSSDCAKTIDVDGLAQGAYFVRITSDNLNMVRKLIVR